MEISNLFQLDFEKKNLRSVRLRLVQMLEQQTHYKKGLSQSNSANPCRKSEKPKIEVVLPPHQRANRLLYNSLAGKDTLQVQVNCVAVSLFRFITYVVADIYHCYHIKGLEKNQNKFLCSSTSK